MEEGDKFELEVGQTMTIICVEDEGPLRACEDCIFCDFESDFCKRFPCTKGERGDGKAVHFEQVK